MDEKSAKSRELASESDIKEIADYFAAAFTVIDPNLLRVIIAPHLESLISLFVSFPMFLSIPQHLLASSSSPVMVDILLGYLITHMPELANPITTMQQPSTPAAHKTEGKNPASSNSSKSKISPAAHARGQRSSTLVKLFKMVFGTITIYPDNEKILRPRLQALILLCLRFAHESRVSVNFCYVLRSIFRTINSSKIDGAYKETAPILPIIISGSFMLHLFLKYCR